MKPGKEIFKNFINENTAIGDNYEKQPFFHRQVQQVKAGNVLIIERPYSHTGKSNIPGNKHQHHYQYPAKQ